MKKGKENLIVFEMFCLNVVRAISMGAKESIQTITTHLEDRDIAEFFYRKYSDTVIMGLSWDEDFQKIDELFARYSAWDADKFHEKFGIYGDDSGLLVLLMCAFEIFEDMYEDH